MTLPCLPLPERGVSLQFLRIFLKELHAGADVNEVVNTIVKPRTAAFKGEYYRLLQHYDFNTDNCATNAAGRAAGHGTRVGRATSSMAGRRPSIRIGGRGKDISAGAGSPYVGPGTFMVSHVWNSSLKDTLSVVVTYMEKEVRRDAVRRSAVR
jgi:hypothetical protein